MAKKIKERQLAEEEKRNIEFSKLWHKYYEEYITSDEFVECCEPFEEVVKKFNLLYEQYKDSYDELTKNLEEKAVRREYSKGELIEGGFYSPTNIDLVTNIHKGRLYKKTPKTHTYNFEYLFDEEGKLICSKRWADGKIDPWQIEILLYIENKVLRLYYDLYDKELTLVTECQYEKGLLVRCETGEFRNSLDLRELFNGAIINNRDKCCYRCYVEINNYKNGLLESFCWHEYYPSDKDVGHALLSQHKHTFERNEEGYLSTYTIQELDKFRLAFREKYYEKYYGKYEPQVHKVPLTKRRK